MFMSWGRRARTQSRSLTCRPRVIVRRPKIRLEVESLEQRLAPATLAVDATHTFSQELQAAAPGDTVQIEPAGTIGNLQQNTANITSAAAAGATTIDVDESFTPGQVVNITSAVNVDVELVDAVSGSGSNFTLTLHAPLQFNHPSGTTAPVANTIGIGKAVTVQGDPAHPPSALLSNLTLQYFRENGAVGPDALRNLALSSVDGTTGGNLAITGNTFNVTGGMTGAVNTFALGTLTISNNTITVGSGAGLSTLVEGGTNGGAVAFAGDTVNVNSNLGGTCVLLFSSGGPISVSNTKLTISGTVGGDGLFVSTSGNVTVASTTVKLTGAVTDSGIDLNGGGCSVSNISLNAGSSIGVSGIIVKANGDVVVSGANSVTATGPVTADGFVVSSSAAANVTNVTVDLKNNVGGDALAVAATGSSTLNNAHVTVGGNVAGDGINMSGSAGNGTMSLSNISAALSGTAMSGVYAATGGNLSVSGIESVTVTGALGQYGMYLGSQDGDIVVSSSLGLKYGGVVQTGLDVAAGSGTITLSAPVQVQVGGNVNNAVMLSTSGAISISAVTVTLANIAVNGLNVEGGGLTVNGPIAVNVKGAISMGAYLRASNGDLAIHAGINLTLGADVDTGLKLASDQGNLTDNSTIKVAVSGSASDAINMNAAGNITLSGSGSLAVGGAANHGLYVMTDAGFMTDTVGFGVQITGAVNAAVLVNANGATLANFHVTAANIADGTGLSAQTQNGPLTITAIAVTANGGNSGAMGVQLLSEDAAIVASGIKVNVTGQANSGLTADANHGPVALSNAAVRITGAVAQTGINVQAGSTMNVAGLSATLQSGAGFGMELQGNGVTVSGPLTATVSGTLNENGIYITNGAGALTVSSPISLTVAGSANDGIYLNGNHGSIVDNGNLTANIAGNVSNVAVFCVAETDVTVAGSITVAVGGTAGTGVSASANDGAVTQTGPLKVSVAGKVGLAGVNFDANTGVHMGGVNITLGHGASQYGAEATVQNGNLNLNGLTLNVTSPVGQDGLYLRANTDISTSNVSVRLSSTAQFGIDADAQAGNVGMKNTVLKVTGNVASEGGHFDAGSAVNLANLQATLGGTADVGVNVHAMYNSVNVTGLTLQQTGAAGSDGASFVSAYSNVSVTASTVTLGGTAGNGIYATAAAGDAAFTGVTLKAAGPVTSGFDVSSQGNILVTGDSITLNGGLATAADDALQATASAGNLTISKNTIVTHMTPGVGIAAAAAGSLNLTNNKISLSGGTAARLSSASGNPQIVVGNTFNSGGGVGLDFDSAAGMAALVQGNNFQGNQTGVQIIGDGQSAGDIDLGGGDLGGTGGNNFKGFNGAAHYAIALSNTNGTNTVFALHNLFSVGQPSTVIQDGTHNSNAVGTGIIKLS